ncbi:MAG: sulfite exporter TauE/SafE family protein [Actinomycetaceae bacterium]|nr:sulfite exporter TauE/SafE family protein [Actinomycetaceae bacterium]
MGFLFILTAGFFAGILGYLTGLASLFSYPALLALGVPAVYANTTNTVALIGSGIGSIISNRKRLASYKSGYSKLLQVIVASVAGFVGGAALLYFDSSIFEGLVPWFVLAGTLMFMFSKRIHAYISSRQGRQQAPKLLYMLALFVVNVYCGYFGAGAGTILLAVMTMMTDINIHDGIALKAFLLFFANVTSSIVFIVQGTVIWRDAIAMGIGALLGGYAGPKVQRYISEKLMRILVIIGGFVLTGWLLWSFIASL